jgi:hypothetical protein
VCPLFADTAAGGFEAIHLGIALATEAAIGGLSVLFFAGTIVECGVRINPDVYGRITFNMNDRGGSLGES